MTRQPMKALLVEDNPDDAVLIREMLTAHERPEFELAHVERLGDALQRLNGEPFDVILLDLALPDSRGLETFTRVQTRIPKMPIVVLTGFEDEATAVKAVQLGAQHYLAKGQVDGKLLAPLLRDAIERKRQEQFKDDFLSTVAHELRTPMNIIREGIAQVLEGVGGAPTEAQRRLLGFSLQAIDRLIRIVNELLHVAKLEARQVRLSRRPVNLVALMQGVRDSFSARAAAKGLAIRLRHPEQGVVVYADTDRITEVFTNLVDNAVKFTERGHVELSVIEREDAVECRVSDTGRGIAEKDLPKVFERFQHVGRQTARTGGTGLGLAIAKGLIELHGGTMGVHSRLHEGTTFSFTLPKRSGRGRTGGGLERRHAR